MIIWKIKTSAGYEDIECAWTSRIKAKEYIFNVIADEEWDLLDSSIDSSIDRSSFFFVVFNPRTKKNFTIEIEPLFLDEEPFI